MIKKRTNINKKFNLIKSENTETKRISIDLPESIVIKLDKLRKEWGLRARGPVIEKLLTEILTEDLFLTDNVQQSLNFDNFDDISSISNFDEESSIILIDNKEKINEKNKLKNKKDSEIDTEIKEISKIDLPRFVKSNVNNLKRSLNSEKITEKINDYQLKTINEKDIFNCHLEVSKHWKNLYGRNPNEIIIEASMNWFSTDIWPNIDGTDQLPFTWTAANKLMKEICPFWIKNNPSLENVILMVGVLEDPFATSDLINRIPTLVRRFVSKFKKTNKGNSFEALDSTMTVIRALKLLKLSTEAGSSHNLKKIRHAYKEKALGCHPDSGGTNEEMRKLNEAYQLLKNFYRK